MKIKVAVPNSRMSMELEPRMEAKSTKSESGDERSTEAEEDAKSEGMSSPVIKVYGSMEAALVTGVTKTDAVQSSPNEA